MMSHDLPAIEAAAAALSCEDRQHLLTFLTNSLPASNAAHPVGPMTVPGTGQHSMLDIETLSVGKVLRPFDADDDVFGEMLGERM